jgi:uncharacterized protein involved in type VI secretion and phage assembly
MSKNADVLGRPHSGLISYPVPALVVDNVDPDELGRIRVKFPTLHLEGGGDTTSWWVRQSAPMAGKERGFYALPEIDDEVLVAFMQGSQDVGVIIGQFWNGVDIPPKEAKDGMPGSSKTTTGGSVSTATFSDGTTSLATNDRRFWKSRSGHLFVFDDSSGAETVQIWDKNHELCLAFDSAAGLITLSNTKADIHIRAKGAVYIEAGTEISYKAGTSITGESGTSTALKSGTSHAIEAGTSADMKAGTTMALEASATLDAKALTTTIKGDTMVSVQGGATAELKGGAMATVKGGVVMIN